MSMLTPILSTAQQKASDTAFIDDRGTYTYGHLLHGAAVMAQVIRDTTQNQHIGVMLPTGAAFPNALVGVWLAGRVMVPLNYLLSPEELGYVIVDSGIDTIITANAMLEFMGGRERLPSSMNVIVMDEVQFEQTTPAIAPPNFDADDLAVILYTSGTSGKPKGVMLSHGNFASNVEAAIAHAGLRDEDKFLGMLPQFHSFGLTALTLIPMRLGAQTIYTARFIPKRVVSLIREHQPHIVMAVPSMYGALLSVKEADKEDFRELRLAISGGEPLPAATFERFQKRFNVKILEGYGLTETAPITNWSTPDRYRQHAVGPAIPGVKIVIADTDDQILPPNEEGEILIAGPNIMQGYYHLPEQTDEVFVDLETHDDQGNPTRLKFFRTGDMGRLDDEGYLFITGRKKEMLIIAGENVFPREIEEVLNRHESVRDSAVIGKQDGLRGEVPIAFVELAEGAAFDEKALRAWCRDNLAQFKVPREIRCIEQLPRNPTGKILRRQLSA